MELTVINWSHFKHDLISILDTILASLWITFRGCPFMKHFFLFSPWTCMNSNWKVWSYFLFCLQWGEIVKNLTREWIAYNEKWGFLRCVIHSSVWFWFLKWSVRTASKLTEAWSKANWEIDLPQKSCSVEQICLYDFSLGSSLLLVGINKVQLPGLLCVCTRAPDFYTLDISF